MKYEFIESHKDQYLVAEICECFEIKPSGYYAWKVRSPSQRTIAEAAYCKRIEELYEASGKREGHRVIHSHLQDENVACGRDLIGHPQIKGIKTSPQNHNSQTKQAN
jgi:hypothetical protein